MPKLTLVIWGISAVATVSPFLSVVTRYIPPSVARMQKFETLKLSLLQKLAAGKFQSRLLCETQAGTLNREKAQNAQNRSEGDRPKFRDLGKFPSEMVETFLLSGVLFNSGTESPPKLKTDKHLKHL